MLKRTLPLAAALFGLIVPALSQDYPDQTNRPYQDSGSRDRDQNYNYPDQIPGGTKIRVRTNNTIDVRDRANNRVYTGTITEDVTGENGRVMIPRGANAELIVTDTGSNNMAVDLESVTFRGRR